MRGFLFREKLRTMRTRNESTNAGERDRCPGALDGTGLDRFFESYRQPKKCQEGLTML